MKNELTINGYDAYTKWGVSLLQGSLAALMTPAPIKQIISNESRVAHGKEVYIKETYLDSREVSLQFSIVGKTQSQFNDNYTAFVEELQKGYIDIQVSSHYQEAYHLVYNSCSQFALTMTSARCQAKLTVKFTEFNPNDRRQ